MIDSFELRSPKFEQAGLTIPGEAANLQKVFSGTVCSSKGDEYEIRNNIIDLINNHSPASTVAQWSNEWTVTAESYEPLWRRNAVAWFSGTEFDLDKEKELLKKWLAPSQGEKFLDIGCSTALYARFILHACPEAIVVALDYSKPMLRRARSEAAAEHVNLFLLRADAHEMPFFKQTFDGLVSGGTLNELSDPLKMLFEARRIITEQGRFFLMHLVESRSLIFRTLQKAGSIGGIHFWSLEESNRMFRRAGFEPAQQQQAGLICFTLLKPV